MCVPSLPFSPRHTDPEDYSTSSAVSDMGGTAHAHADPATPHTPCLSLHWWLSGKKKKQSCGLSVVQSSVIGQETGRRRKRSWSWSVKSLLFLQPCVLPFIYTGSSTRCKNDTAFNVTLEWCVTLLFLLLSLCCRFLFVDLQVFQVWEEQATNEFTFIHAFH